eukprot:4795692-Karenia_brevis.AAC.1
MHTGRSPGMLLRRFALKCSHFACCAANASSAGKYCVHDAGGVSSILIHSNGLFCLRAKARASRFAYVHAA